jgi:hypothetical protein
MTAAVLLAQLLQDEECSKLVSTIRQKTQDAIDQLMRSKQLLDNKLAEIKKDFATKRAELERQEASLLESTVKEHKEPVISVSGSLVRLYDNVDGTDTTHAPWKRGCDPALLDDAFSASEGTTEHSIGGEVGEGSMKAADEDIEVVDQLPAHPIPMPTVDAGLNELAPTGGQTRTVKDEDENPLEEDQYFECPEIALDDQENGPKRPPEDPPYNQQIAATNTTNITSEGGHEPEVTAAFGPDDPDLQEYEKGYLSEANISPAPTYLGKNGDVADQGPSKSPIVVVAPVENGEITLEA